MLVGDSSVFAIESGITEAVPNAGQLALGFFVIHVGGRCYGVREPDASMLGCSFGAVADRVRRRGTYCASALENIGAALLAEAYLDAVYRDTARTDYFGLSRSEFSEILHSNALIWAPDGDAAFDDGSHILQFDVGDRVRLIAFVNAGVSGDLNGTIREEWLDADLSHSLLSRWTASFSEERAGKLEPRS